MVLYVVRHGETDWNRQKRIQGSADTDLNESGVAQAALLAQHLETNGIRPERISGDYKSSDPCERDCTDHSRNKADPSFGRPQDQRDRFWRV